MRTASSRARAWLGATLLLLVLALSMSAGRGEGQAPVAGTPVAGAPPICPPSLVPNGHDYHNLVLGLCSFTGQDLTGANFAGARLFGVIFIKTNLTDADFSGATFETAGVARPTDFTFANLTRAKFVGAKFNGPTYFTYATLSCVDFSSPVSGTTDLSDGSAIFGDTPLLIDPKNCRPKFRGTTMNCEFIAQWKLLDMTNAKITGCTDLAKGQDFSGGIYSNAAFDNLDLSGSRWHGAKLDGASFQGANLDDATGLAGSQAVYAVLPQTLWNGASLKNVDLSYAQLYGANFTYANLENVNLQGAFLTSNTTAVPPIDAPANLTGAHLKNVNLAVAHLAGAVFTNASFYGTAVFRTPPATCSTDLGMCKAMPATGATCSCATAAGADLTGTKFDHAFLYGVDFTGPNTRLNGTDFTGAVLVGANFSGATWNVDPDNHGSAPSLANAYLQGVDLHDANLTGADLTGAYVDFGAASNPTDGNIIAVLLSADYGKFVGWPASPDGICVQLNYGGRPPVGHFSLLPTTTKMTCPNGRVAPDGCGPLVATNSAWNRGTSLGSASPPGYYVNAASFDKADPANPRCSVAKRDPSW